MIIHQIDPSMRYIDKARTIAANIAKLQELLRKPLPAAVVGRRTARVIKILGKF